MAQEQSKDVAKDQAASAEVGTKCAFSGVRLRKVKRYYRNGQYYINKRAYQEHAKQLKEKGEEDKASALEKQKAEAAAATATAAPQAEVQSAPATQDAVQDAAQDEAKDQGKKE